MGLIKLLNTINLLVPKQLETNYFTLPLFCKIKQYQNDPIVFLPAELPPSAAAPRRNKHPPFQMSTCVEGGSDRGRGMENTQAVGPVSQLPLCAPSKWFRKPCLWEGMAAEGQYQIWTPVENGNKDTDTQTRTHAHTQPLNFVMIKNLQMNFGKTSDN